MSQPDFAVLTEEPAALHAPGAETLLADPGLQPLDPVHAATGAALLEPPATGAPRLSGDVTRKLIGGTSTLGLGVLIERGAGFLANLLAARFAGAGTFGAYSLAISTANNISTYAAGGIDATAARFSGKYAYGSAGYTTLARALAIVSLVSAIVAMGALWLGAAPIAQLLHRASLTYLLRWAALSAGGIILLGCARGFFVGQRRLAALLLLSVLVGGGMVILLPIAARLHHPIQMVVVQGAITSSAVILCLLLARPLGLNQAAGAIKPLPLGPMLREVWSFGFVQLAGLIGSNLAGLWLTTLIARSDPSLVQMGFFTIASQLRNLAGIAPGLLTEGSYAVMADPHGEQTKTPHRVMALCTFASTSVSLLLAALGIVVAPWVVTLLYGKTYGQAAVTVAIALAIAVTHMGNAPAAARLTIVSIRATGVINTVWAVFVAVAACSFFFVGGGAWQAMAIYFAGHLISSGLVLLTLKRKDHIPSGMTSLYFFSTALSTALASLAILRGYAPRLTGAVTGIMAILFLLSAAGLFGLGKRYGWLPTADAMQAMRSKAQTRLAALRTRKAVRHV